MANRINLLPDQVANQIAAGEVVQRPSSAVKELLENSIDAGAKNLQLIIKNAGKSLIQVIDDGFGMNPEDALSCLQRHATSKIKTADDLFKIKTMGFRGEAIPSIAAISQFELKTRSEETELGNHIKVEGNELKSNESCAQSVGTQILVKNLFYNVPARRNFLKSNPVETKHIIEEFVRVALIHPEIEMSMRNEQQMVYQLPKSNFKQRIVKLFGEKYNQRLVPVTEQTAIVQLNGFIGKPEFARKTRGEQYLFVNGRFIKSPYLNHAINKAYEELIPNDLHPSYFLMMEIDPAKIDINIHPTKTEVKFEEERSIYAIIRTAVRQALGKFNIAPSLDFEQEQSFNVPILKSGETVASPNIMVDQNFNPFKHKEFRNSSPSFSPPREKQAIQSNWENLYEEPVQSQMATSTSIETEKELVQSNLVQVHGRYILSQLKSGFILIDQQRAHERVLIEEIGKQFANQELSSQQLLFPEELTFSASDYALLDSMLDDLGKMGFDIRSFGKNALIVDGIPSQSAESNAKVLVDDLLENFKLQEDQLANKPKINLIRSLAKSMRMKKGTKMNPIEMQNLLDQLFACEMPYHLPNGLPIVVNFNLDEINKKFKRSN